MSLPTATSPQSVFPLLIALDSRAFLKSASVFEAPSLSSHYLALEVTSSAAPSAYERLGSLQTIAANMNAVGEERFVLQNAVRNLWRVYRYHQHYIGFLGGGVSEDDFTIAAEKFARCPIFFSQPDLRKASHFILPLIEDDEMSPEDLAVVLNADASQLELALNE